ncbi:MAG: STAS domain-containing protein [Actinomycetota bacterium]|nr:STAS domain-containing protein [Actinomycetota bacterium]MDQ5808133.1 STAS domain-containing protein [Actinomycetota bacterium]
MTRERLGSDRNLVVVHAHTETADVLSLIGELDLISAPRFVSQAAEALRAGAKRLFVELDGVSFVDSAGLAALLNVLRRSTAARARMVLVGVQPPVRNVLAQTRLEREFDFAPTVDDAACK